MASSLQADHCLIKLSKRVDAKSLTLTKIKKIWQKVEKLYDVLYQKSCGFHEQVCFRPGCPYHHSYAQPQHRLQPLQIYLPVFFNAVLLLYHDQEGGDEIQITAVEFDLLYANMVTLFDKIPKEVPSMLLTKVLA